MATPCEELGYKVGDWFVVSSEKYTSHKIGTLLTLTRDDCSECPMFETDEGEIACPYLDWVKPLAKKAQLTPQTTTEPDIIARLTQAAKAANDLHALISELNALLPDGYEVVRTTEVTTEVTTDDMSDWRNWREGDLVTPDNDLSTGWWMVGHTYKVAERFGSIGVIDGDGDFRKCPTAATLRFHSRPSKEAR